MAFFNKVFTTDIPHHEGQEVTLAGVVWRVRDHGKVAFCDLMDGEGVVQGVARSPEVVRVLTDLRPSTPVIARGIVHRRPERMVNPREHLGAWEVVFSSIEVLAVPEEPPFDLDATNLTLETLLDYRPLTVRRERERAIFRVQALLVARYRQELRKRHFVEIQAPKIVGGDAEGGARVFPVRYLRGVTAALATSPQLYKQIMVGAFERVYTVGPAFRAEKHATTRHLNEYVSLDAEMGFVESHEDVMEIHEEVVRAMVEAVMRQHGDTLERFQVSPPQLPSQPFPRLPLPDAHALLAQEGMGGGDVDDLSPEQERWLSAWARREYGSDFLFVTHYPLSVRPFYTMEDPDRPGYTRSFDLLFRGVEITTGGQRLHRHEDYLVRLRERGLDPETFSFYLMAFRYGMPPHGGWGMGLERLTQKVLNLASVKEATLFVRDITRIDRRLADSRTIPSTREGGEATDADASGL